MRQISEVKRYLQGLSSTALTDEVLSNLLQLDGNPPQAPLYTQYIKKKHEYRAHVFGGKVIDIQQKRKKRGFDDERNTRIRNLHNGYIYSREGIEPPEDLQDQATRAVAACQYQYGAVDVIWNEKQNKSYVLEVNSRPGLMGTTVERYADAIVEMFNLKRK
jgi:glutathione synthase/RimK-type ligase-like ATP-grasp enzyme